MIKIVTVFAVLMFLSCAPAVRMQDRPGYYPEQNALLNSEDEFSDSLADPDQTDSNMGPYLKGYNDGMMTAKNASQGCCLVGGCLLGASGVAAGVYAPSLLFGDPYGYSETTQTLIVILSLVGGIAAGVGSVYLANDVLNVAVPDPMAEDSLYRKGFMEGYRVTFKSQRLRESLKGTAIGVGITCVGVAVVALLFVAIIASMW